MAQNPFEQFGLREVANVTFEDITDGKIAIYLDTLKVSTLEQTAEETQAEGGEGNSTLIIWDLVPSRGPLAA